MHQKRFSFTMIELVFIIIVIGILAVIAIPKLSATRDDAKMSALAHNIMATAFEVAAYAAARADIDSDYTLMSNTARKMNAEGSVRLVGSGSYPSYAYYDVLGAVPCATLTIDRATTAIRDDANMTIAFSNSGNNALCDDLHNIIEQGVFPIKLKGQTVVR